MVRAGAETLWLFHHLTSAQVVLLVGAVASGALESADMGVGVVWRPPAATFSVIRFLADATAGRRSACTVFGANSAGRSARALTAVSLASNDEKDQHETGLRGWGERTRTQISGHEPCI
jgi:hypothetical protein